MTADDIRQPREAIVRRHMKAENALDFETALATFTHARYELVAIDTVHEGAEEVARYFVESRKVFPDQRNELISLRHADDAVIVEFWLLGTHKGDGQVLSLPDDRLLHLRRREARLRTCLLRYEHDPAAAHGVTLDSS